jgi:ABC-2 type transport system permease protein
MLNSFRQITPGSDSLRSQLRGDPDERGPRMTSVRIFFVGGLMSYRAMFGWMNPWILVPSLIVSPICQILLFAYIGRSAGVRDDEFYVIGNALNYAAIPCLFAMASTIEGERQGHTLGIVLTTPARRIPLFLGRALPVILNGWGVAMVGVVAGVLLLDAHIPGSAWPALLLVVLVTSASCTGLGLAMGAVVLRVREGATFGNVVFCVLLVFCGVNVALEDLPGWMAAVGTWLPLTHGIEAGRLLADGGTLGEVGGLVLREIGVGGLYTVAGLALLGYFERESRRTASLERV